MKTDRSFHVREFWRRMSIEKKARITLWLMIVMIGAMTMFCLYVMDVSRSIGDILSDIALCENAQEAMRAEGTAFHQLIRSNTPDTAQAYRDTCARTKECLNLLPSEYAKIGSERMARTENIRSVYGVYIRMREAVLESALNDKVDVDTLYDVYELQDILDGYLRTLTQLTVDQGIEEYGIWYPLIQRIPAFLAGMAIVLLLAALAINRVFTRYLVDPIRKLSASARRIEKNDFSGEDVDRPGEDEMGELVTAFNRMKHAMGDHIETLNENPNPPTMLGRME